MEPAIRTLLDNLRSQDSQVRNTAYYSAMEITQSPVDWAYEAWDGIVTGLKHKDNHVRAIAAQILSNLAAYSDPENRIGKDFAALLNVTRDAKFVTARHALQSLWKIGTAGNAQQEMVVDGFARRFADCAAEKNATLIRYDIAQGLRNLYDALGDESIRQRALALIETETDVKYRKKYGTVWKTK